MLRLSISLAHVHVGEDGIHSHIVVPCTLTAAPPPAATVTDAPTPTCVPLIVWPLAHRPTISCKKSVRSPEDFILSVDCPQQIRRDGRRPLSGQREDGRKEREGTSEQRTMLAYVSLATRAL